MHGAAAVGGIVDELAVGEVRADRRAHLDGSAVVGRGVALEAAVGEVGRGREAVDGSSELGGVVGEHAVGHVDRRHLQNRKRATDSVARKALADGAVAERQALEAAARGSCALNGHDCAADAGTRQHGRLRGSEPAEMQDLSVDGDAAGERPATDRDRRARWRRVDCSLHGRVARSTHHELASAVVEHAVPVEIGRDARGKITRVELAVGIAVAAHAHCDVAGVDASVAVAVERSAAGEVARVERAVAIAVICRELARVGHAVSIAVDRTAEQVAAVGQSVAVAVGSSPSGDFTRVDRAVAVAVDAARASCEREGAAGCDLADRRCARGYGCLTERVPAPCHDAPIGLERQRVLARACRDGDHARESGRDGGLAEQCRAPRDDRAVGAETDAVVAARRDRLQGAHARGHVRLTEVVQTPCRDRAVCPHAERVRTAERDARHGAQSARHVAFTVDVAAPHHHAAVRLAHTAVIRTGSELRNRAVCGRRHVALSECVVAPPDDGAVGESGKAVVAARCNQPCIRHARGHCALTEGIGTPCDDIAVATERKAVVAAGGNGAGEVDVGRQLALAVVVLAPRDRPADLAEVCDGVAVAVCERAACDVTRVRDVVAVAVGRGTAGDVAAIGDAVGVAVAAAVVRDIIQLDDGADLVEARARAAAVVPATIREPHQPVLAWGAGLLARLGRCPVGVAPGFACRPGPVAIRLGAAVRLRAPEPRERTAQRGMDRSLLRC